MESNEFQWITVNCNEIAITGNDLQWITRNYDEKQWNAMKSIEIAMKSNEL